MSSETEARKPPRERILAAAGRRFHTSGVKSVGVDTIAELAGTNKMTLYRHFQSKDVLVGHWLRGVAASTLADWQDVVAKHPKSPARQLNAWIAAVSDSLDDHDHACDLTNASVELYGRNYTANDIIADFREDQIQFLSGLLEAASFERHALMAQTLVTLLTGARVSKRMGGVSMRFAGKRFREMAEAVIAGFSAGHASRTKA